MTNLDEFYSVIRRKMRMFRKEKGITQRELAEKIGVSEGYISDIERDSKDKHPSIDCLLKISDVLGIELVDLLSKENNYGE